MLPRIRGRARSNVRLTVALLALTCVGISTFTATAANAAHSRRPAVTSRSHHRFAHKSSVNLKAAPTITVSGYTLTWRAIGSVRTYVLVRKVAGQDHRSIVTGTTVTPPILPGATARYTVRAYIYGSKWSPEVTVRYPSAAVPPPVPPITPPPVVGPSLGPEGTGTSGSGSGSSTEGSTTGTGSGGGTEGSGPESAGGTEGSGTGTGTGGGGTEGSGSGGGTEGSGLGPEAFGLPFVKGVNTNLAGWSVSNTPQIAAEITALGANWEREDLDWSSVESKPGVYNWTQFEQVLTAAQAKGITILPILGYAPSWTNPGNATAYAEFVAAAVARFGPGTSFNLQWFELWNEPYFPYAWSNKTPEPEAYARDVVAASQAAKAVAPSVKFLVAADYTDAPQTGGTSPWETTWVHDMLVAEPNLGKWVDGVSVHPYGDDPSNPVATAGGWKDASNGWSFQRIDTIRAKFQAGGVNLPFWITEEGWSSWETSEAQIAKNYADLTVQIKARPWVRALFPYCLREFSARPTNNQPGFGLLKFGTWQPKAGYLQLQEGYKTLS
jgi:polysaccharide biosynthesis protein PslG